MFGISFTELTLVLVIGFIIIGPKKMTALAYDMGQWVGKLKAQLHGIKDISVNPIIDVKEIYKPIIETKGVKRTEKIL